MDGHVLYKTLFSHIRELNNGCELSLMILFIKRINGIYVKVRKVVVSLYILKKIGIVSIRKTFTTMCFILKHVTILHLNMIDVNFFK
jgi:hypothetical protein